MKNKLNQLNFNNLLVLDTDIDKYYFNKNKWSKNSVNTIKPIEFYTLPAEFILTNHSISKSGWEKVMTKKLDMDKYKNEIGFEQIANDLGIEYPNKLVIELAKKNDEIKCP